MAEVRSRISSPESDCKYNHHVSQEENKKEGKGEQSQWQHEPVPAGPVVLLLLYLLFLIHTFYLAALGLRGSMWIFTEEH